MGDACIAQWISLLTLAQDWSEGSTTRAGRLAPGTTWIGGSVNSEAGKDEMVEREALVSAVSRTPAL
jgi:hypothetical protein